MAIIATHVAAVQELYVAYFGRPADVAGLDYWTNVVQAQGGSLTAVSATFAKEKEYTDLFAGKTNAQIVDAIYTNMFGHAADAAGRTYWVDLLNAGTIKIDTIVAEVANGALGSDADAVENKVVAATAFTNALDLAAEQAGYSGPTAAGLAKAFIASVTTDASLEAAISTAALNATVAAVVTAGTPFTLEGALANLLAANDAKSDVLAGLADDEAVAARLTANGVTGTPTDAQILAAIAAIDAAGDAGINGIITGFASLTSAQQTARIASVQADNAAALRTANTALTARTEAVAEVDNLSDAYAEYQVAVEAQGGATQAAALATTGLNAAVANFQTLARGTLTPVVVNSEVTGYNFTVTSTGTVTPVITINASGEAVLATGITEGRFTGVTAAVTAINANIVAQDNLADANTELSNATLGADILDSADEYANLEAVAEAMVFVELGTDALPTYAEILAERAFFTNQIDAQVTAFGGTLAEYTTAINTLESEVATLMAGASPTAAALDARLDTAVTANVITQAQANTIQAQFGTTTAAIAAVNTAVDNVNFPALSAAFESAVAVLLADEGTEVGIGALVDALLQQQETVDGINTSIENFADAVAAYNAAQVLNGAVTGANTAITNATKVITDNGFAAPVTLSQAVTLATAKDDIFIAGSTAVSLRNFGSQGDDALYVGTSLTYNETEIGSGTGQTALRAAGDNSALEFFLQQSGSNVLVHIENKNFGSESGAAADLTTITLVGVNLDDLVIENGFITL